MGILRLQRERIPWFPAIDPDLCIGDQVCIAFCKNNVLAFDENTFKVIVANPYNCVVGCDSCAKICPQEAIHFPGQGALRAMLRRLRSEALDAKPVVSPAVDATPAGRS